MSKLLANPAGEFRDLMFSDDDLRLIAEKLKGDDDPRAVFVYGRAMSELVHRRLLDKQQAAGTTVLIGGKLYPVDSVEIQVDNVDVTPIQSAQRVYVPGLQTILVKGLHHVDEKYLMNSFHQNAAIQISIGRGNQMEATALCDILRIGSTANLSSFPVIDLDLRPRAGSFTYL